MTPQPKTVAELRETIERGPTSIDTARPGGYQYENAGFKEALDDLCRRAEANERLRELTTVLCECVDAVSEGIKQISDAGNCMPWVAYRNNNAKRLAGEIREALAAAPSQEPKADEVRWHRAEDEIAELRAKLEAAEADAKRVAVEALNEAIEGMIPIMGEAVSFEVVRKLRDKYAALKPAKPRGKPHEFTIVDEAEPAKPEPVPDETRIIGMDCAMRRDARSQKDAVMDALDAAEPVPDAARAARAEGDKVLREFMQSCRDNHRLGNETDAVLDELCRRALEGK